MGGRTSWEGDLSGYVPRWITAGLLGLLGLASGPTAAYGQQADTLSYPRQTFDATARLNGSQVGFWNWEQGGIPSLSAIAQWTSAFERSTRNWSQAFDLRLRLGIVKQDTLAVRKSEDAVDLKGEVSYRGDGFFETFNPTVTMELQTQFAVGFNYDENPFEDSRTPPVKVADLLSPAIFLQSLGLTYASKGGFKQQIGLGAKATVVSIRRIRTLYGLEPSQAVRLQTGARSYTEMDREVFRNVRIQSSLRLFLGTFHSRGIDMTWETLVRMKVNRWLSTDFEVTVLFDRDISRNVQVKEILSVGISVDIL